MRAVEDAYMAGACPKARACADTKNVYRVGAHPNLVTGREIIAVFTAARDTARIRAVIQEFLLLNTWIGQRL